MHCIGSSLVPLLPCRAHLRRHRHKELALEDAAQLPAVAQVLQQRLAAKLHEHVNGADPGIDQIAEYEINDSVFSAKRDRRLRALSGQWIELRAFAPRQYKS